MRTSLGFARRLCNDVHIPLQPTRSQSASLTSTDGDSISCASTEMLLRLYRLDCDNDSGIYINISSNTKTNTNTTTNLCGYSKLDGRESSVWLFQVGWEKKCRPADWIIGSIYLSANLQWQLHICIMLCVQTCSGNFVFPSINMMYL